MEFGNHIGVVSVAYLVVLLPWGFLYIHDFISDHWLPLKTTRRNGFLHVIVVILPMPYLVFYISSQIILDDPDWKEMYAAITALVLSIYHLARTVWGLRQLLRFRVWAIRTAVTFARADYVIRSPSPENVSAEEESSRRSSSFLRPTQSSRALTLGVSPSTILENISRTRKRVSRKKTIDFSPENTSSRDLAIAIPHTPPDVSDRHIKTANIKCHTHSIKKSSSAPAPSRTPTLTKSSRSSEHDKLCTRFGVPPTSQVNIMEILVEIDNMLVNSTVIDNEFIGSSAPRLSLFRMRPFNPVDTFVRWSVCFLAQFGWQWLRDCDVRFFSQDTWEGRRYSLAADVWATAALRMDTNCKYASTTRLSRVPGNEFSVSFLSPALWQELLPHMKDQLFCKEALLEKCYRNGKGFPYEKPIFSDNVSAGPNPAIVAPGMFKSLIKDAQSELPSHLYNVVDGLEPYQLEWFAIFISVVSWSGCTTGSNSPQREGSPHVPNTPQSTRVKNINRRAIFAPFHAPVRTLQDQLGFIDDLTLDKCSFPFVAQTYGRELWHNRSILQVSARIDNWLALRIGHQYVGLLKNNPKLNAYSPHLSTDRSFHTNNSTGIVDSSVDDDDNESHPKLHHQSTNIPLEGSNWNTQSNRIFHFHRDLEITRLRYQLATSDTSDTIHHNQGQCISFMGCVMETVRSFLAEHLVIENTVDPALDSWAPQLPVDLGTTVPISLQFADCLDKIASDSPHYSSAFDSTVKERLLWECQNGIVRWLEQKFVKATINFRAERRPQFLAQTMLLTLLAFPALVIKQWHLDDSAPEGCLSFKIEAPASPQAIFVIVTANSTQRSMYLRLSTERGGPTRFRWQDWRDAFLGRLDGKAFWQQTHYMRDLQINRTIASINCGFSEVRVGEGRSIPVWNGWLPFRARIRKFELEHSSLIIVGDRMPFDRMRTPGDSVDALIDSGTADEVNASETVQAEAIPIRNRSRVAPADEAPTRLSAMSSSEAYVQAGPSALSDASSYVDSVLKLNSSLFDKSQSQDLTESASEDEGPLKAFMVFAPIRTSPDSSASSLSPHEGTTPPMAQVELISQVNNQDPEAMYSLAKCLLSGTRPFRKDRDRALLLLERAVSIGRRLRTARLFVKTLLERQPVTEEDAQRALGAVEKLWRDLPRRRRLTEGVSAEREQRRMTHLTRLHVRIIHVYKRAEVMRDLGNRIATFGTSQEDDERATVLFESAIIADCDVWAMIGLALRRAETDFSYARKLYERAAKIWRVSTMTVQENGLPHNVADHVLQLAKDGDVAAKLLLGWKVR